MINQRPDLFSAYIGTGQAADLTHSLRASYKRTLAEARAAHDERAANDLARIGPPGAYGPESDRAVPMPKLYQEMFAADLPAYAFTVWSMRDSFLQQMYALPLR